MFNSPLLFASPADGGQTEGEAAAMAEALDDVEGKVVHYIVQDVTLAYHVIRTKTEPVGPGEVKGQARSERDVKMLRIDEDGDRSKAPEKTVILITLEYCY